MTDSNVTSPASRRRFLATASALGAVAVTPRYSSGADVGNLRVAPFRFDVTPPMGHSLCGGWILPVKAVDDPLEAIGYVLLGAGKPIVVCAVDWTGILNSAHFKWRAAMARAAGTTPDRVAVHCVHQHNAPFACVDAEKIVLAQGDLPSIVSLGFFNHCLEAAERSVSEAVRRAVPVTHIAHGQAAVKKVAGNRRILGPDGKVASQRGSSSKNPEHHRLPEGLIDPMLKTVALYHEDKPVVASHYYACHPMSYYGDGRVSADFCGLARKQLQKEDPDCTHIYFNGCGGNIGAGKYNDGSHEMRPILVKRMLAGMVASHKELKPKPIESVSWTTHPIRPRADKRFDEEQLLQQISDKKQRVVARNRPSYTVAYLQRALDQLPITLSALHVNDVSTLHLPAESFIEYQLRAQAEKPNRFVACAAYGDGGPWYIPTKEAYPQGGYAVSVAWCDRAIDDELTAGIKQLLS